MNTDNTKDYTEMVSSVIEDIQERKTKWLYKCLWTLHRGIPFDPEEIAKVVQDQGYKIINQHFTEDRKDTWYLIYSKDFSGDGTLTYLADFSVVWGDATEGISTNHTFPTFDAEGRLLKTKITFEDTTK